MEHPLVAVVTCHKNQIATAAQRATWAAQTSVRFFYGAGHVSQRADEVVLNAPDNYLGLPYKVQALIRWALDKGYKRLFKCDDDAYVVVARLLAAPTSEYLGNMSGGYAHGGAGYWLGENAMKTLAEAPVFGKSEDGWVAKTLFRFGIFGTHDARYQYVRRTHGDPMPPLPTAENDLILSAEFSPEEMYKVHRGFIHPPDPTERMSADEYKRYLRGGKI